MASEALVHQFARVLLLSVYYLFIGQIYMAAHLARSDVRSWVVYDQKPKDEEDVLQTR